MLSKCIDLTFPIFGVPANDTFMDFQSLLLFFFSGLGAFNGLILGLYFLIYARPKHRNHLYLGMLLLALSIRVGKSVFYYFDYNLADVYIQIGLLACWFIGPSLYFYVKSALELPGDKDREARFHFAILVPVALLLFFLFPRSQYEQLWISLLIWIIYWQWMAYVLIAGYLIWKNKYKFQQSGLSRSSFKLWFFSIYWGNVVICLAFSMAYYTYYILGALCFSFVFYLLILLLFFTTKRNNLLFLRPPRNREKQIDGEEAALLVNKLERMMKEEELFKNSNLSMPATAKKLKITPHKLSLLLNDNMKVSFSNYLNGKRIEAAQHLIKTNLNHSLEAIGYDCGFNSKSAFYAAFKKHVGTTPAQFRKSHAKGGV